MKPTAPAPQSDNLRSEDSRALRHLAEDMRRRAQAADHRLTLVLTGSTDWTLNAAAVVLSTQAGSETTWLSNRPLEQPHDPLAGAEKLLGGELDILIYDAHGGFDPNGFGAALGALRGGGLFVLLIPPLAVWPELVDPEAARVAIYPFTAERITGRFIRRFRDVLTRASGVSFVYQGRPVPPPAGGPGARRSPAAHTRGDCRSPDQAQAVAAIVRTARTRAHRPLVITSDRGRGKSSALGIAAARLLAEGGHRLLATAPRRAAVEPLMRHAARLLPEARVHTNRLEHRDGVLEFQPPDALCLTPRCADLLLVDEAAGIPAALLEQMLKRYPRLVFATTVHGYEGSGRGFDVRFRQTLDRLTPNWIALELQTPIRWSTNDPLEELVSQALLLNAAPAPESGLLDAEASSCRHQRLNRERLGRDTILLPQLFGLLVLAHYQTRPLDLRHLLDGPNIRVHVLTHAGHVAATALVALEGGLDDALSRQIFEGKRRPQGHLLPQTLCAHAGIAPAPRLRYARIVRIAVHPTARGRGLGRKLLERIFREARAEELDFVGASFGATEDLLRFWSRCGYEPVHLGTRRNAASGAYAAVVLRPLTAAGEDLHSNARGRLAHRLPSLLAGPLHALEPQIAAALLRARPPGKVTSAPAMDWAELDAFASAHRPYEAAVPPVDRLLRAHLGDALSERLLSGSQCTALIAKLLQHRSWCETAGLVGASGRAEVISLLREGVGRLVQSYRPLANRTH